MRTNGFDPRDPTSVRSILATYKQAYVSSRIHKGADIWCEKHFMTKSLRVLLASRPYLENKKTSDKLEGMPFSWKVVFNHRLETYATDYVIAEAEMHIQNFEQPSSMTLNQYVGAFRTKALR